MDGLVQSAPKTVAAAAAPPPRRSVWPWILGLAVVALAVAWLLGLFSPPPPAPRPEPTPQVTAPTPAPAAPESVAGTISDALTRLTSTLSGIQDRASAEAALPTLNTLRDTLNSAAPAVNSLSDTAKSTLSSAINAALPTLRTAQERLLGNSDIAGVIGPVLTELMDRLSGLLG